MKIAYIGNHNQTNSADDEGAIAHALTELGHKVELFSEKVSFPALVRYFPDMVLFHKWGNSSMLYKIKCVKVAWYFDLFKEDEEVLSNRNLARIDWLEQTLPNVDALFCTDGQMVTKYEGYCKEKLYYLTQGIDARLVSSSKVYDNIKNYANSYRPIDLLITASVRNGTKRAEFIRKLKERYGDKLLHITNGVYRENLIDRLSSIKVVVAPNAPIADYYYSNRIYNTLGLGACLVHPKTIGLSYQYEEGRDYLSYQPDCIEDAYRAIDHALGLKTEDRLRLVKNGHFTTLAYHTYNIRVQTMMETLKLRGLI